MPTNNKRYIGVKYKKVINQGKTYQSYDKSPELELVLARAKDEGYTLPSETIQIALDQYIKGLKSNGLWQKPDILFNFAYNNTALLNFSKINLKNPLAVTNLVKYSTNFSNAVWTYNSALKEPNTLDTLAPDGSQTACKLQNLGVSSVASQVGITVNNTTLTYSIYTKGGTATSAIFRLRDDTTVTNKVSVTINYSTGTITDTNGTGTIENVGNGWYRISMRADDCVIGNSYRIYVGDTTNQSNGLSWYVWGAQLEDREKASKYQPTFGNTPVYGNGVCLLFNNPTYTINGFEGNGTNMYIDTRFNPVLTGRSYTLNNASRSFVLYKDGGASSRREGVLPNNANCNIGVASTTALRINQGTTDFTGGVNTTGIGFKSLNRDNSTNVRYTNLSTESARTVNSTLITSSNQVLLAFGNVYGTDGMSTYMMGSSLTFAEGQTLRTLYNAYLTKIGLTAFA